MLYYFCQIWKPSSIPDQAKELNRKVGCIQYLVIRRAYITRESSITHPHLAFSELRQGGRGEVRQGQHPSGTSGSPAHATLAPPVSHSCAGYLHTRIHPHPHPTTLYGLLSLPSSSLTCLPTSQQPAYLFLHPLALFLSLTLSPSALSHFTPKLSSAFLSPLSRPRSFNQFTRPFQPARALTRVRNSQRTDRSDNSADQPSSILQLPRSTRLST